MKCKEIILFSILFLLSITFISSIHAEGISVSERGIEYDNDILSNFNFTDTEKKYFKEGNLEAIKSKEIKLVHVTVDLKDFSNITISKDDSVESQGEKVNQRENIYMNTSESVLSTLSEGEFQFDGRLTNGRAFYGNITKEGFDKLLRDERVRKIYAKKEVELFLAQSGPLINADNVWSSYNGSGQTVCVIDTGVDYTLSDLGGCFGSGCKVAGGYDYVDEDSNPLDESGHGTNVAGIVASTNSFNKGIANGAKIVALRACDNGCDENDIRNSLIWCFDNRLTYNISVVTMSLGGPNGFGECGEDYANDEISDLYDIAGIPIIVASGNGDDEDQISYPACNSQTISVGATYDYNAGEEVNWCEEIWDGTLVLGVCYRGSNYSYLPTLQFSCIDTPQIDEIACFTNRGPLLKLLAPGSSITASGSIYSGTSQAAPHVAGAAALLLQKDPTLEPDKILDILMETGVNVGSWKRIDVEAALEYLPDPCSCGSWSVGSCGSGSCASNQKPWTRTCNPSACAAETQCVFDASCEEQEPSPVEGELSNCTYDNYDQCIRYEIGDCDVSLAVNHYTNVNNIQWGAVNDSWDPYVIGNYTFGWRDVDALDVYYDVDNPGTDGTEDCHYGGCDTGEEVSDMGTIISVNATGTAHREIILGFDQEVVNACWAWFNDFDPNYGASNPIYILNCFNDSDCSSGKYCGKVGSWNNWSCINKKSNGQSCTIDNQCSSSYCDNDGVGLSDDGWCFSPYNTYFDGQETSYCEYSTNNNSVVADCDERQVGTDLNKCIGIAYKEEECSSSCGYQDVASVFECTDSGCSCSEPLCDGLTSGSDITNCSSGETYFADECASAANGMDRDDVCRNSTFAAGCSADSQCNGIVAGTNGCDFNCRFSYIKIDLVYPSQNINVTKNKFFNFTTQVCCLGSINCGDIDVSLDPKKVYDSETRTVIIKNISNAEETIAEIQLLSDLVVKVPSGYQKVAEFKVRSYGDYDEALKDIKFYDLKRGDEEIQKDFDYKYKTTKEVLVDIYENKCTSSISGNGTEVISCIRIKNGERRETVELWEDYAGTKVIDGETTIGIFTYVNKDDKIEWVPTLFGTDINEWAVFEWNGDIISYYSLNETSGAVIDSANFKNGTVVNSVTRGRFGKINNSYTWENQTADRYVNLTWGKGFNFSDGITLSLWFNSTDSDDGALIGSRASPNHLNLLSLGSANQTPSLYFNLSTGQQIINLNNNITTNKWYFIAATYNKTNGNVNLYLFNETSLVENKVLNGLSGEIILGTDWLLGLDNHTFQQTIRRFVGKIDEVGIWNRSLSEGEIFALWNQGEGCSYQDETCVLGKDGLVSMNSSATPFYTNTSNPYNITLNQSQCQNVTWWVNATGEENGYIFFVYANNSYIYNETKKITININDETVSSSSNISTCQQLQDMQDDLSINYSLMNDINCSDTINWNSGLGFKPIGNSTNPFTGTFNGNNYTISNLYINRPTEDYAGLFGYISESDISNIGLVNVNVSGNEFVGALAGAANTNSIIFNSNFGGNVNGSISVGGLVGSFVSSNISNSYSTGNVIGGERVGGLIGQSSYSNISNSFASGNVKGSFTEVGGLIGLITAYSNILNSYSTGNVTGTDNIGGLLGESVSIVSISNSYSTGNINGSVYVGGLVGQFLSASSNISNSFATGNVTGTVAAALIGRFISSSPSYITNLYWNNHSGNPSYCWRNSTGGYNINCTAISDNIAYFKGDVYPNNAPMSSWVFFSIWQERTNDFPSLTWQNLGGDIKGPITFVDPTPSNNTNTSNTSIRINTSIEFGNLKEAIFNWNSTNYTLFNNSVALMYNLDNRSSLGENSTRVVDITGNGKNGTVTNALFNSTGKFNGDYTFDGNGDYISRTSTLLTTTYPFTMSAWFIKNRTNEGGIFLIENGDEIGANYGVGAGTKGIIYADPGDTPYSTQGITTINDNKWHHIVGVFSSNSDKRLYIDGVNEANLTTSIAYNILGDVNAVTVGYSLSREVYFNGSIDEVIFFNRSLSSSEIQQLYFSNLYKYNSTQWYLYVNQSKNSTAGLSTGSYNYRVFGKNSTGYNHSSEKRVININV